MDAESFFNRWEQRNAQARESARAAEPATDVPPLEPSKPPTLDALARLTHDDDFTPFVARGVDEDLRRSAMKKLFSDPRFNVMDGLDVYIGDYNTPDPIPPAMLAALNHAQALLRPLEETDSSNASITQTLSRLMPPDDGGAPAIDAAPAPVVPVSTDAPNEASTEDKSSNEDDI